MNDLEAIFSAMADDDDDDDDGMTDIQLVTRLRDVFEGLQEKSTFAPGDILEHKFPSLANTASADKPVVFIGYLDRPVDSSSLPYTDARLLHSNASGEVLDCRIGKISDGIFSVYLVSSRNYRHHPDFPNT